MKTSILSLICFLIVSSSTLTQSETYDVVVYGGTSGGVTAGVQAARMGKSVVVIEPSQHLGGLTSGGLGATDIGNKSVIGGISREFYQRIATHYDKDSAWTFQKPSEYKSRRKSPDDHSMWTFEPHVAEEIMEKFVKEFGVHVVKGERLDLKNGVVKENGSIRSIKMESGKTFSGLMFIDATYEGDLMAKAGVSYHVGRESNSVYNETMNGVQTILYRKWEDGTHAANMKNHNFRRPVDPYVIPGDPTSGVLPGVQSGSPGKYGAGDHRIQAYNFRTCLTDAKENQIPFPKPKGYDPLRYELLLRYLKTGIFDVMNLSTPMPNHKTDTNNKGAFASDNIGMNYEYPDGDYATREQIFQDHVEYQQGLMWFLVNDSRVPKNVSKEMGRWGLTKDEFLDNGGWPHQLYVREARRMISDMVMTEHHCRRHEVIEDSVGMAAYGMDSHNVQRFVSNGIVLNEGNVEVGPLSPYPISYRAIRPKKEECKNLLVPVCVSSSHIAFGSIRMEPVFMVLGQSAATAACIAIDDKQAVQDIDYTKLHKNLMADKQVLSQP